MDHWRSARVRFAQTFGKDELAAAVLAPCSPQTTRRETLRRRRNKEILAVATDSTRSFLVKDERPFSRDEVRRLNLPGSTIGSATSIFCATCM